MTSSNEVQKQIDVYFASPLGTDRLTPIERTLQAARKGYCNPDALDEAEIRLVCETLLIQYAQMGIS